MRVVVGKQLWFSQSATLSCDTFSGTKSRTKHSVDRYVQGYKDDINNRTLNK